MRTYDILKGRFPEHTYALMQEVSDAAGFNRSRSADYIAVCLWPSKGLSITGIELKSHRGDWLNELKNPAKSQNIFQYCDHFYLLTSNESVAKIEEIPDSWGWMVIKGERTFIKKSAPKLNPIATSKDFMVAMLKRASDKSKYVHIDSIQHKIDLAFKEGEESTERKVKKLQDNINELSGIIKEFEKASGTELRDSYRWDHSPEKIGAAVKFIKDGGLPQLKKDLIDLEKNAQQILTDIQNGIKSVSLNDK